MLLDPISNIVRRSRGYYSRGRIPQQGQARVRRQAQDWANMRRNDTNMFNRQGMPSPDLGPGYFQPQQQAYGGYPAAPSPAGSNNQLYNPAYATNGFAPPNSEYYPGFNGTAFGNQNMNNNYGMPQPSMPGAPWNFTNVNNPSMNPQVSMGRNNGPPNANPGLGSESMYMSGPQTCVALSGERITVQPLAGTQPGGKWVFTSSFTSPLDSSRLGNNPSMSYQSTSSLASLILSSRSSLALQISW